MLYRFIAAVFFLLFITLVSDQSAESFCCGTCVKVSRVQMYVNILKLCYVIMLLFYNIHNAINRHFLYN